MLSALTVLAGGNKKGWGKLGGGRKKKHRKKEEKKTMEKSKQEGKQTENFETFWWSSDSKRSRDLSSNKQPPVVPTPTTATTPTAS